MACRLVRGGCRVAAWDIEPGARAAFAQDCPGAVAESASAAMERATVVITILPDGKAVQAALLDGGAPVGKAATGAIVIEMSSSSPVDTEKLGTELAARGLKLIDAPVSGGVKRAVDGSLAIMVGGETAEIERCRPILALMGTSLFPTGRLGSGHAMKALNNYVSAAGLTAALEALIVGSRFGLEPGTIVDVLNKSSGRNNATENKLKQFVLSGSYGAGFALGLLAKDVSIADGLARHLGVTADGLAAATRLWREARDAMPADTDHTGIHEFLRRRAGIS